MDVDYAKLEIKIVAEPEADDLEQIIDSQMIIEFYSK
jgi:ribosomal protein S4